jgi:hypothetical protein
MTPEQLMEIPGIGEKMVDKIYQAVNRFYEGGGEATAAASEPAEAPVEGGESPAGEADTAVEATEAIEEKPAAKGLAEDEPTEAKADTDPSEEAKS